MTENDVFANIANNDISSRKELLKDILPNKYDADVFKKSSKLITYIEKTYEENLNEYKKGLKELRIKHEPYLKRHAKQLNRPKERIYINKFRYSFNNSNDYEDITIPHYHGPVGRWESEYITEVDTCKLDNDKKTYIVFKGVDYYADIYINNEFVMHHEGFFAPFECDISKYINKSIKLKIVVKNDLPTIGSNNMHLNGDKLYAATGLGWDNPEDGWHHCPAGGGIFDKVYIEQREVIYVKDLYIRPDIDNNKAYVNVNLYSNIDENTSRDINIEVMPYNFKANELYKVNENIPLGYGNNFYSFEIKLNEFKLWECDSPFMYICQCSVEKSEKEATFGMRKFHMDIESEVKGDFYLNNEKVILRGANEMGHLQLCVTNDDYDQLIDDILIAKYCNMNMYRITQRPVQEEIYDYCDMLGMMNQVDLPLFGYMRKNQFYEGVKQAGEMERLVRNHPSVIVATYINEPFAPEKYNLAHRHLNRVELELFFDACDASIYFENPDRVIKRVEGDYDPPTNKGLSDFHCYNMWYTNHAIPLGMLYKGYLPAVKEGWKVGCGEYGAEGLDNLDVMKEYYPKEWLPENDTDYWIPDKIIKAQTNTMHGDWYEEQDNIKDWIIKSQEHQAFATKLMTEAFRRRNDILIYTAIHLLIDAWPSGWMKTLLDVNRIPKLGYFSFKESQLPLKVSSRCDRWQAYEGETVNVEAWILNDSNKQYNDMSIYATVRDSYCEYESFKLDNISIEACVSKVAGIIPVKIPETGKDNVIYVDIEMVNEFGSVNIERFTIKTYPVVKNKFKVCPIGIKAKELVNECDYLQAAEFDEQCSLIVSSPLEYKKNEVKYSNNKKIFIVSDNYDEYTINGERYEIKQIFPEEVGENCDIKGLSFVACDKEYQNEYGNNGFSYWYNNDKDYIDHVCTHYFEGKFDKTIAFSFEKPSFGKITKGKKSRKVTAAEYMSNSFISLEIKGRVNYNPIIDRLIINMIKNLEEK